MHKDYLSTEISLEDVVEKVRNLNVPPGFEFKSPTDNYLLYYTKPRGRKYIQILIY